MPKGICKLCVQEKDLVRSHLMAAALYDYCRQGEFRPLMLGRGMILPTDRQTQAYLLCEVCEDVLNKKGESWANSKFATMDKKFPLYDLLTQVTPVPIDDGFSLYWAGDNSEIKVAMLTHFAMGIFWKASVHSWRGDEKEPRIELGPYSDRKSTRLNSSHLGISY